MIIYETKGIIAMVSIVVAMDSKRGIGKNNDLLFRIPEDFERMKKLTAGHPIIMGRRTFESIGRVLPGRTNIVISRNPAAGKLVDESPNLIFCSSLEEALRVAKEKEERATPLRQGSEGQSEIFIFGGGQVFKEAIEKGLVDRLYLTIVEGDYGADTFFPDYSKFKIVEKEERSDGKYKYSFITLKRSKSE